MTGGPTCQMLWNQLNTSSVWWKAISTTDSYPEKSHLCSKMLSFLSLSQTQAHWEQLKPIPPPHSCCYGNRDDMFNMFPCSLKKKEKTEPQELGWNQLCVIKPGFIDPSAALVYPQLNTYSLQPITRSCGVVWVVWSLGEGECEHWQIGRVKTVTATTKMLGV